MQYEVFIFFSRLVTRLTRGSCYRGLNYLEMIGRQTKITSRYRESTVPWFTVSTFEKEWFPGSLFLFMYSSMGNRAVFTFLASARDLVLSLNTEANIRKMSTWHVHISISTR